MFRLPVDRARLTRAALSWRGKDSHIGPVLPEQRKGWDLMIFCARATRGLRRMGKAAWPSSCSRNAHDKNVLVRRAQSRIDQATLENKIGNSKTVAVEDQSAPILEAITSELGKMGGNSQAILLARRARSEGQPGHSLEERSRDLKRPRSTAALRPTWRPFLLREQRGQPRPLP